MNKFVNFAFRSQPLFTHPLKRLYHEGVDNKVYLVCLTGGPCAGKTTALSDIVQSFPNHIIYTVPELATTVINAGVSINHSGKPNSTARDLVSCFLKQMLETESYFIKVAKYETKDVIIVTDRGVMDPKAYETQENWEMILKKHNWTEDDISNERYDLVCHLVTAADGAIDYYTLSNNTARRESPDEARELDKKTQSCWLSHHNFKIIGNHYGSFQKKLNKIHEAIGNLVGYNPSYNLSTKYLLPKDLDINSTIPEYIIWTQHKEQVDYISCENPEEKSMYIIARENKNGEYMYTHTVRYLSKSINERREQKRKIMKPVYRLFYSQKNQKKKSLYKQITTFNYSNNNFVIEEFFDGNDYQNKTHCIMRFERFAGDDGIDVKKPKWLPFG